MGVGRDWFESFYDEGVRFTATDAILDYCDVHPEHHTVRLLGIEMNAPYARRLAEKLVTLADESERAH